jgi:hypothetical protein
MQVNLSVIDWNAVSAVVSVLAFLGLFLTLREMKRQRRSTYRPLLAVMERKLIVQKNKNGVPTMWKEDYDHADDTYPGYNTFTLTNAGLAAAHNVLVKWDIDVRGITATLDGHSAKSPLLHKGARDESFVQYFFGPSSERGYGFGFGTDDLEHRFTILGREQSCSLKVPAVLYTFLSLHPFFRYAETNQERLQFMIDKGIAVSVECRDLENRKLTWKYNLRADVFMNPGFGEGRENILIATITFE